MSEYDHIDVYVKGTAETKFISATFKASVTTMGETGPQAKEKATPVIERLKQTIVQHAAAGIDTERLKTTFAVDVDQDYQTRAFRGYRATYTVEFTAANVAEAPKVHDALTSIPNVVSPTPVYNVDDSAAVYKEAFQNAFEKAAKRFEDQCQALGLDSRDYYIRTWNVREEGSSGKMLSVNEGVKAKAVGLEPGKASLDMNVTFTYGQIPSPRQTCRYAG